MTGALTIFKDAGTATGNTLVVDTTGLVYDATNKRVGIGTASPVKILEVLKDSSPQLQLPQLQLSYDGTHYVGLGASSAGNFIIDATGPSLALEGNVVNWTWSVPGAATTAQVAEMNFNPIYSDPSGRTVLAKIGFTRPSTTNGEYPGDIRFWVRTHGSPIDEVARLHASKGFSFGKGYVATDPGVDNMIIEGDVGIGTTTPAAKLHVDGGTLTSDGYGMKAVVTSEFDGTDAHAYTYESTFKDSDLTGYAYANRYVATVTGSSTINKLFSFYSRSYMSSTGAVGTFSGFATDPYFWGSSGDVTDVVGMELRGGAYGGGATSTITNWKQLWIAQPIRGTNRYGIYIDDITGGTANYAIYSAGGKSYFAGNVGVNTDPVDTTQILTSKTFTDTSGNLYALNFTQHANPAAESSANHIGVQGTVRTTEANDQNFTGIFYGANISAIHQGTGTMDDAYGARFYIQNTSTGTITNSYTTRLYKTANASGTVTNAYSLYVDEQTDVTNAYEAWFDGGGEIFFRDSTIHIGSLADGYLDLTADTGIRLNGNVGISTATPSTKLEVAGTASGRHLHAQTLLTASGTISFETPLPLSEGGTSKNMTAANGGICYSDADSLELTSAGTSGQLLLSTGVGAPVWSNLTATGMLAWFIAGDVNTGTGQSLRYRAPVDMKLKDVKMQIELAPTVSALVIDRLIPVLIQKKEIMYFLIH